MNREEKGYASVLREDKRSVGGGVIAQQQIGVLKICTVETVKAGITLSGFVGKIGSSASKNFILNKS